MNLDNFSLFLFIDCLFTTFSLKYSIDMQAISSDSKDYFGSTICECSIEDDDYHPSISNQPLPIEDFTPATFHPTHFYSNSN